MGGSSLEEASAVTFLQKMLQQAVDLRASDLHFEPYEFNYRVRFRIDGELREVASPPLGLKDTLASRIKVISRLDIAEKRVPQDGRFRLRLRGKTIDFRVSIMPSVHGEDAVIRILDKEVPLRPGMSDDTPMDEAPMFVSAKASRYAVLAVLTACGREPPPTQRRPRGWSRIAP
mgnify:CR=1 FL=1